MEIDALIEEINSKIVSLLEEGKLYIINTDGTITEIQKDFTLLLVPTYQ